MKRLKWMFSVLLAMCVATVLFAPHAGAQNPNDECAAVGGVYLDKLDGIPDLGAGEQYTGTTDMGATVTVQFEGPFAYTVISSTLPGGSYIEVAKFGNGGGFSHLTFCTSAAQPEVPVIPEIPVIPDVPQVPEVPVVPEEPQLPEVPQVPEMPVIPEVPQVPEVPQSPEVPQISPTPEAPVAPAAPSAGESGPQTVNPTGFVAGPVLGVSNLPAAGSGDAEPRGRSHLSILLLMGAAALAGTGFMVTRDNHSPGRR